MMILAMFFMASCGAGGSSHYEQGGPAPSINTENGTINGHFYDMKTPHCWKVTFNYTVKVLGATTNGSNVSYQWGTEFDVVSEQETAMWTAAQTGTYASSSYSYIRTSDKDYDSCLKHN